MLHAILQKQLWGLIGVSLVLPPGLDVLHCLP
jgi:hypothetical protein